MRSELYDFTVELCVERGKREILADIANGTVPATVASFTQLHDYVDANYYGGAFDKGGPSTDWDGWNETQIRLNAWLEGGGVNNDY
jgi:hypothetical protein